MVATDTSGRFEIFEVSTAEQIHEIAELRLRVWKSTPFYSKDRFQDANWVDEHDQHGMHWAVRMDGHLIAAARLCVHHELCEAPDFSTFPQKRLLRKEDFPFAMLSRLVVDPIARGFRLGERLDAIRIEKARSMSEIQSVLAKPVPYRVQSLARVGFSVIGEHDIDLDRYKVGPIVPGSLWMILQINRSPAAALDRRLSAHRLKGVPVRHAD